MEQFLTAAIVEAGELAMRFFREGVTSRCKADFADLVTPADERVNEFLIEQISREFPRATIHSEELAEDINPGRSEEWIIDPIDGTRNFALGIPLWCIMVAFVREGETETAAIYSPLVNSLYFARRGGGAFLNGRQIKVNSTSTTERAMGFLSPTPNGDTSYERFLRGLVTFLSQHGWLVNSATMLNAAFLANGGIDFFASNCGFDHDYIAPALLCREAGAVVTDVDGNPWSRGRRDIVIANPSLHPNVLRLFEGPGPDSGFSSK